MEPLHVTAEIVGSIALPNGPLALDGLLAWAVAQQLNLPPPSIGPLVPIEIPVEREAGGRFHLCSFSVSETELHANRWVNRRFPLAEAQLLGNEKLKRVQITAGPCKSYRLPMETQHLVNDRLDWWCIGERDPIEELLGLVGYLGKKRGVGLGRVRRWTVEPCESWGEGFPVVRDRRALRTLPPDWPGLAEPDLHLKVLSYPYWEHAREELCAAAVSSHAHL